MKTFIKEKMIFGLSAVLVLLLFLSGCQYEEKEDPYLELYVRNDSQSNINISIKQIIRNSEAKGGTVTPYENYNNVEPEHSRRYEGQVGDTKIEIRLVSNSNAVFYYPASDWFDGYGYMGGVVTLSFDGVEIKTVGKQGL